MSDGRPGARRRRPHLPPGRRPLEVLRGVDAEISRPANWWPWSVPSGAGKSTLLHVAGLLEPPDGGEVIGRRQVRPSSATSERTRTAPRIRSVSSISSIICCRSSRPWRTSSAPDDRRAAASAATSAAGDAGRVGLNDRADAPAGAAFRRRAAAGRHRPGAGQRPGRAAGRRADRQPGSAHRGRRVRPAGGLVRDPGLAALIATHNIALAERMDRDACPPSSSGLDGMSPVLLWALIHLSAPGGIGPGEGKRHGRLPCVAGGRQRIVSRPRRFPIEILCTSGHDPRLVRSLRTHSAYSLSEGALHIKALVALCREMGMPAVAVTDRATCSARWSSPWRRRDRRACSRSSAAS